MAEGQRSPQGIEFCILCSSYPLVLFTIGLFALFEKVV